MGPQLSVRVDDRQLKRMAGNMLKQGVFATAVAINRVANLAQKEEQGRLQRVMTIRRAWVLKGIKIENRNRATKDKLVTIIETDDARQFLAKFEQGDPKLPRRAGGAIAVPVDVRRTSKGSISKRNRPVGLELRPVVSKRGTVRWQGRNRTFILPGIGIAQRVGRRGSSQVRLLYLFEDRTRTPEILGMFDTVRVTVETKFAEQFGIAFDQAMRTAR